MFDTIKKLYSANKQVISETTPGKKIAKFASKAGEKIKSTVYTINHTSLADVAQKVSDSTPVLVLRAVKEGVQAARAFKQVQVDGQDTSPSA